MEEENIRQVIYSEEFNDFYDSLDSRIQDKFDYGLRLIKTQYVVNKKFVKHLENTDFMNCVYLSVLMSIGRYCLQ